MTTGEMVELLKIVDNGRKRKNGEAETSHARASIPSLHRTLHESMEHPSEEYAVPLMNPSPDSPCPLHEHTLHSSLLGCGTCEIEKTGQQCVLT